MDVVQPPHPANKMTKITNFASSGPNELKIGQRCGAVKKLLTGASTYLGFKTDADYVLVNFYLFTTSAYV